MSGHVAAEFGQRTHDALADLVDFAALAKRLVARGKTAYDGDVVNRLAAEAIVHRMGEAVTRLSAAFVTAHPEVEWALIKGMRNIVAHQYGNVDHEILWAALATKLPDDVRRIKAILAE